MKNKKVLALAMAAAMMVAPISASAAEWQGPNGNGVNGDGLNVDGSELTDDQKEYGHTTFSIIEAKQNPNNVSFEVPLYVTMAAVNQKASLMVPNNYDIYNTSGKKITEGVNELENEADGFNIAVIGMDFTKLENAKYSTVETVGGSATDLQLTLGDVVMPAIPASTTTEVTKKIDLQESTNVFFNATTKKWTAIPVGVDADYENPNATNKLNIEIVGTLGTAPVDLGNVGAAPQFKVKYTVGALDDQGNLMGSVYAGDDKMLAGLVKASN